jgi:SAM-dependent methyltransferases related to tRNA (uracil-5-)-methyltransferase
VELSKMTIQRGQEIEIQITDFAFGGRGIGKIETENGLFVVFVDNTFPGQFVRAKIDIKRKNHAEAKLLEIIKRSEYETETQFQEISGGPTFEFQLEIQEKFKQESTIEIFSRLSGIKDAHLKFDTFISSPEHYFYRNKMEYSFSSIEYCLETNTEKDAAFSLGFKRRGTWWKVESLNKASGLFDKEWEDKLFLIRNFLEKNRITCLAPTKKK